jgi:hypothetical protein
MTKFFSNQKSFMMVSSLIVVILRLKNKKQIMNLFNKSDIINMKNSIIQKGEYT